MPDHSDIETPLTFLFGDEQKSEEKLIDVLSVLLVSASAYDGGHGVPLQ